MFAVHVLEAPGDKLKEPATMNIPFWKMHGASNDFILVDDRVETFPVADAAWLARIASRRTGVGSDGIILIQASANADFRMRFFNPDGNEVDMCGNGARCVARLAHDLGAAAERMSFDTPAGRIGAEICGDQVLVQMTNPTRWRLEQSLTLNGVEMPYHFVDSGVPHVVVPVADVSAVDVHRVGSGIRHHDAFAPDGTNANFFEVTGANTLTIRTYERGVEGETLACGTGIVAGALIAGRLGTVTSPVLVRPASGDVIEVGFTRTDDGARDVTMRGPAEYVFQGTLEYPG